MKTRMIRDKIRELGTERGVIVVLETLNERVGDLEAAMTSTVQLTEMLAENIARMNAINDGVKAHIDDINKKLTGNDMGVSMHSELVDKDE